MMNPNATSFRDGTLTGYLRKKAAARYLGIAARTLNEWMAAGIVPFIRVRHTILFRIKDLDRAMDKYRLRAVGE
ncbi:MAG: helix-turn-helix domain-containing protein [Lentisphaerae bacterium]|nr:helix-turn-helix domain-containing protein [Lentisphaerota bacterium]